MQKVIAIVGPTGSGKTALGIALAKKFNGEIISADSRQIYRGMDRITGVPSLQEMDGVPHHLLRIADPKKQFSAGAFVSSAKKTIRYIVYSGKMPIVLGGSGFYIDSLLSDVELPRAAPNLTLRGQLERKSSAQLFAQLRRLDPRRAKTIDPKNKTRLIRAIEIAKTLGSVPKITYAPRYNVLWLGLSVPKKYEQKIRNRIDTRLTKGMIAEARHLRSSLSKKRYDELGFEFQLLADYLDKKISKKELENDLARWELKYAKRQIRWLKRNQKIHWIKNKKEAFVLTKKFLNKKA